MDRPFCNKQDQDEHQHSTAIHYEQKAIQYASLSTHLWADDKHAVLEEQHGSTASSHRINVQLRCLNGNACSSSLKHMFIMTVESRHICASATHIKTNDRHLGLLVKRCQCISNDAASRARQDGLEAREIAHGHQTTIALHELQLGCPLFKPIVKSAYKPLDVLLDTRRQIGICSG